MKAKSSKPRAKAAKRIASSVTSATVKSAPPTSDASSTDEIVAMAGRLAGSSAKARDWYRTYPIPAFGGVTAEFLVDHGRAKEVREYLNAVVLGEFA